MKNLLSFLQFHSLVPPPISDARKGVELTMVKMLKVIYKEPLVYIVMHTVTYSHIFSQIFVILSHCITYSHI